MVHELSARLQEMKMSVRRGKEEGRRLREEIAKRVERESPTRSVIRGILRRLRLSPRFLPTRAREGESNKPDVPWARRTKEVRR